MTLSGRRKNSRKLTKRTKRCWPKTGRRSPGARKVNGKARNPLSVPAVERLWRTGTLTSAIYNYTRGIDDEIEMWPSSPSFNLMKCWRADVGQFWDWCSGTQSETHLKWNWYQNCNMYQRQRIVGYHRIGVEMGPISVVSTVVKSVWKKRSEGYLIKSIQW